MTPSATDTVVVAATAVAAVVAVVAAVVAVVSLVSFCSFFFCDRGFGPLFVGG
jgi:hypothetical protein